MENGKMKKITSIILIVAMIFANSGISVLAESIDTTIANAQSEKKETPNYYYGEDFDDVEYEEIIEEQTIVEEYEEYLEEKNPGVFDDEKEEDDENTILPEEEIEEEIENELEEESEIDKEEELENELEEVEDEKDEELEEIENEEDKEKETSDKKEVETEKNIENEKEIDTYDEASESETEENFDVEEETEETKENIATDSESVVDENIIASESEIEEDVEKNISTDSELDIVENKTASDSEINENDIASISEIEDVDVATDSEIDIASESEIDVATESEIDVATGSEIEASASETSKEILIATVSKTSWKVKTILLATYSTTYADASESEVERMARLATCANVVLIDDDGNEKLIVVPVKWKLDKKINVDAHTKRNEKPVSVETWREKYKVNKIIDEQEKEVIVATKAFSDFVEKIKNEHEEEIEKEIVIVEKETKEDVANEDDVEDISEEKEIEKNSEEASEKVTETTNENIDLETSEEKNIEIAESEDETADSLDFVGDIKETEEEKISPVEEEIETEENLITEPTVADFASTDLASDSEIVEDDKYNDESNDNELNSNEEDIQNEAKTEQENIDDIATESEIQEEAQEEKQEKEIEKIDNFEEATDSEIEKIDDYEKATDSEIATDSELVEESGVKNKMSLSEYQLGFMEVESINLFKVDVDELSKAIAEAINEDPIEVKEENDVKESTDSEIEKEENGIIDNILKLFGFGKTKENSEENKKEFEIEKEEKTAEEELIEALKNVNVNVVEESEVSSIIAEQDAMRLKFGAAHDEHTVNDLIKELDTYKTKIVTLGLEGDVPIGGNVSINQFPDLTPFAKEKPLSGQYYLPGDLEIKIKIIANMDLFICTNGHNITFATMGYIKADPGCKVIICNCKNDVSKLHTGEPTYNYKDRYYATTSETYTKYHEKPLVEADDVIVIGKHSLTTPNINFEGSVIKNQYVGKNAVDKMEADYQELDDPEVSGGGSLLFAKNDMRVYGVDFKNNIATRTNGVAINTQMASLTLENCNFIGNKNLSNVGGAIALNPKDTKIYNCKFENNESNTMGGAIYARAFEGAATKSGTTMENVTFTKNKARLEGGAIFFDYVAGTIKIGGSGSDKKVIFSNNEAGVCGGAIAFNHNVFTSAGGSSSSNEYEKWPDVSSERKLDIENVDFTENKARTDTGANENFGGAVYISNLHKVKYSGTEIMYPLLKSAKFKNVNFTKNIAEGKKIEIKEKIGGVYTGPVLAEYYLANYGGAMYVRNISAKVGNGVSNVELEDTNFDENVSMTGASICAYNTMLDIRGGELKNGKAKNDTYKNNELIEKVVTSGGGAIYLMDGAIASLSNTVSVKKNRNAFYLDGGEINIGESEVEENEGEYLIGYSNYTVHPGSRESGEENIPYTNRILFSGVDIENHTYYGAGKDYNASISYVYKGDTKNYYGKKQNTYVSFANTNTIKDNRWVITEESGYTKAEDYNYTEDSKQYRKEICNIAMISSKSNLQIDLSRYSMYKSKTGMIGLYYYLASPDSVDDVIVHSKWKYDDSRVLREGGIWTNYFEVDQSQPGERLEGWKFYIKDTTIRLSPNIFTVKFDSFIEGVEEIAEQHYNYKMNGQLVTIATPTEILYGSHVIPGKTFVGFLGRDKSIGAPASGSYVLWDFNKHRLQADVGVEETLILVYTDDDVKVKACGCPNGVTCQHDNPLDQHIDRGTAVSDTEAAHEMNYIIVATIPQFAYRYGGKKTQYILNKDLNISAKEAKQFLTGDMILNLNGKTFTYDVEGDNDNYIFGGINPSFEYSTENLYEPGNIFIVGNATTSETAPYGKIKIKGKHNGSFINTSTRSIYINKVDFDGEEMVADSINERSIFTNTIGNTNTKINIENSTFENITLNESLISSISNVILKKVTTNKTKKVKIVGKPFINLGSTGIANASELKVVDSVIEGVEADSFAGIKQKSKGTDVKFENVSILENKYDKTFMNLDKTVFGNDTKLTLKGKNLFNANEILTGNSFLIQKAPLVFESSTSETKFDSNIVPTTGTNSIVVFDDVVTIEGAMKFINNKGANAVYQTEKATISVADAEMYVTGNNTTYEWMINNISTTKEMFERTADGKFRASESVVEIKLKNSAIEQIVWRGWKEDNLKTKKIVEKVFIRDSSYAESDRTNIYKGGLDDASLVYFGADYVKGTYYLYPYKAGEDERKTQNKYDDVAKLNIQRIKNNTDTMFDGPREIPAAAKVVMWEGLDYVDNDGKIVDTTKECIYPQDFNGMIINENRDFVISGYSYRENTNRQHRHGVGPELWMEARNEGHLQASTSYVFLHNDVEITHPMLNELVGDYIICLNGHKLIIATDSEWLKDSDGVKINVCDCSTNPGAITIKNGVNYTKDIISATNSEVKIENIKVSAINNTAGRLLKTKGGKLEITKLEVNNVKVDYSTTSSEKSFIEVDKDTQATYSDLSFISNTIKTNIAVSEKQSIMSMNVDSALGKEIELIKIKVDGNTTDNKGSIVLINGYKNVVLNDSKVNNNTVYAGSALNIKGSGTGAVLTINGSVFNANTKVYDSSVQNNTANFDMSGFDEFYMNDSEISDTKYKNTSGLTSDVYTAFYLDDIKANITNTTISNCNKVEGSVTSMFTVMVKGTKPVTFDNCTFKDIESNGSLTEIISVDSSYTNILTLTGSTKLTNLKATNIVDIKSTSGKVLFDGMKLEESEVIEAAIHCNGAAEVIATNSIIKNIKGTSLYVPHDNVKLYNTEITGTPDLHAGDTVYVSNGKTLTVGDKVVIKGYKINLALSVGAKLTTEDDHMITKDSIIYLTTGSGEQEIFDTWSKKNIEKFEHYDDSHVGYFPSDLFKLDDAQKNTKVVYAGGGTTDVNVKGKIYVNDRTSDTYATLIYRDDDVEKKGEITRQYIKAETETRVDKVKVPYLSTRSQMWNADLLHATDSMIAWKITEYYTVNLAKGDTYNVYLVKKHTHKECGTDIASPCGVHVDGSVHTTEFDFVAIAADSDFRVAGRKYFGLQQNMKISQTSLDYLAGISTTEDDPVIICLHGHILTFEASAKLTVANNIIFTNCEPRGYITAENDLSDVMVDSTGGTLKLYNIEFKSINTTNPVVRKSDTNKFYIEKTTFSNITLSGNTVGMIDFGTNKPYINGLAFDKNIATGSTVSTSLLKLSNGNFEKDRVKSVTITNNKFLNGLIRLNGSYTYGLQEFNVKNNVMLGSVAAPYADGALYVALASTLDVGSDFVMEGNDASINENSQGGALLLFGKLNVAGNLVFKNNKAAEGGALNVGTLAKIVASKSSFIGNEADLGAAIHGSVSDDMFSCDEIIFDANKANTHGVVYWNGNLKLENVTFKNHPAGCKELLYNINASDVLTLDKAVFKSNVTEYDAIYLNEVGSTTKISNITTDTRSNNFDNFINVNKGAMTLENVILTNNKFNNAAINISSSSGVVNIIDSEIKENMGNGSINLQHSILGVKGMEKLENIYISDEDSFARAIDKISTKSEMSFTAYKNGIKVFEKWNETIFDNYDKPTASDIVPRKYAYTPENSGIFVLNDVAINKKYEYYKVGNTSNQDIYLGSKDKFVTVTFYNKDDNPAFTYVTQNIAKGEMTRFDKVDTQECKIERQSWLASDSIINEVWAFRNHSISPVSASFSENTTVYYIKPHIHKVCGCDIRIPCSHEDLPCSDTEDYDYKAVANQTDIETIDTTYYNYVYFINDINITGELTIPSGLKGICLNGHKLTKNGDNYSLIKYVPQNSGDIFSICDCKLSGEINITGVKAQTVPVFELDKVSNVGHLTMYNICISSISLAAPVFKNNTGDVNCHVYAENVKIKDIKDIPEVGIIDSAATGTIHIATLSIVDSTINENSLIVMNENMKFGNLYLVNNTSKEDMIKAENISSLSIKGIHANSNTILDGAMIHATNSDINISENVSISSNKTSKGIFNIRNNAKVNINGTAVFMNNESVDGDGGIVNMDSSRFYIASSSVFSENKARNGAAIFARNVNETSGRSDLLIDDAVFINNEVYGGGHGVINYSGMFDPENISFINHTVLASELIYAGEDCDNTIKIKNITFAGNAMTDTLDKYDAIYIKKATKSFITGINKEMFINNKFNNFLDIENGNIELSNINITERNNTFVNSIFNIRNAIIVSIYDDFVIENQSVTNGAFILDNSKVTLGSSKSTKKTKVVIKGNGNGKNIVLKDSNSYFIGADLVGSDDNMSTLSELYIKPLVNGGIVYEGWNEKNIDDYNRLVSTETPIKYMYTPEMSGMFKADGVSSYQVFKKGSESVCIGDNTKYVVLTFKKVPDYDADEDESYRKTYGTQNVASGSETKLDLVDMYDYELKKQEWDVPGYVSRWRFSDDIGNIKDVIANETISKDVTLVNKHLHKLCGDKLTVSCMHTGIGESHAETVDYYYVATVADFATALSHQYIALKKDLVIDNSAISLGQFKGICLNGHTITYVVERRDFSGEDYTYWNQLISLNGTNQMSICDCKHDKAKHGSFTLYDKSYGYNIKSGAYIRVEDTASVNFYNIHFSTMSFLTYQDPIFTNNYYDGCLVFAANPNSKVYMDNPVFNNIQVNGKYGLFGGRHNNRNYNSNGTITLDSPLFTKTNSNSGTDPIIYLNNLIKISTLSMIENETYGPLIDVSGDRVLSATTIKDNNSASNCLINISTGNTVTFIGNNEFSENSSYKGGVFNVTGKLVMDDEVTFENNTGGLYGGSIAVSDDGKIIAHATVSFIGNRGNGAAIYARNINSDAFDFKKVIFDSNKSANAIIDFTGNLKLANAVFKNHESNTSFKDILIKNSGTNDTIDLSNITFTNNTLTRESAMLFDKLAVGSKIHDINTEESKNNNFKNFIDIRNESNVVLSDLVLKGLNCDVSVVNVDNSQGVDISIVSITENDAAYGLYVANDSVTIRNKVIINGNKNKNIYLADDNAFLKGAGYTTPDNYVDKDSKLGITTNHVNQKVFGGWDKYNIEKYDNPDKRKRPLEYMYTPENSGIFIKDSGVTSTYEFYKDGAVAPQDVYLGDDFAKLTFYNDHESLDEPITYGTQNIKKNSTVKIDKVDSFEYELRKQDWKAPNPPSADLTWNFVNPVTGVEQDVTANYGDNQVIKYVQKHIHKLCGKTLLYDCDHTDTSAPIHATTAEFVEIGQDDIDNSFIGLASDVEYISIKEDVIVNGTLTLPARIKGLCLNGHIIKSYGSIAALIDAQVGSEFNICNCRNNKGYITVDGVQTGELIKANGTKLRIYKTEFRNINAAKALISANAGDTYLENVKFTELKGTGASGVLANTSAGTYTIANLILDNNKLETLTPLLTINNNMTISTISVTNNKTKASTIKFDSPSINFGSLVVKGNESTGDGTIYVPAGTTLTLDKDIEFIDNKANRGGAFFVVGNLVADKKTTFIHNTATEKGGAIYIAAGGKVTINGDTLFERNEAKYGSSIYGENLTSGDLKINKASTFRNENVSVDGVISWHGELNLSSPSFVGNTGTCGSLLVNEGGSADKLNLINARFIDNNISSKDAIKLNNIGEANIKNLYIEKGTTVNKFANAINIIGGIVKFTETLHISDNNLANAAISMTQNANVIFNGDVKIEKNTCTAKGAVYAGNGSNVEIQGRSFKVNSNTTTGNLGAAITVDNASNINTQIETFEVTDNKSAKGGAIYVNGVMGIAGTTRAYVYDNKLTNGTQKNIFIANNASYIKATDIINENSKLGFSAAGDNYKVFETWNVINFTKIDNPSGDYSYTPENSKIFVLDDESKASKYEFYKSGVGENEVIKLGKNFVTLTFESADKKLKYSKQNIEKNVLTKLDVVKADVSKYLSEKWIYPDMSTSKAFVDGDVNVKYDADKEIIKSFKYKLVYTAGSKVSEVISGNISSETYEYGEEFIIRNNTYVLSSPCEFNEWNLRTPISGIKGSYKPGDIAKNICNVENGIVYLDALWDDERAVRFYPNAESLDKIIDVDPSFMMIVKKGSKVTLRETYAQSLVDGYLYSTYNTKPDGSGQTYNFGAEIVVGDNDLDFYCMWKKVINKYLVTFDTNGGTSVASQQIDEGKKVVKPSDPTKDGYDFLGWYKTKTGNDKYDFNTLVTKAFTIYAKWKKKETPVPPPVPPPVPINSGGGGGGGGSGIHHSGGYIIDGIFVPFGPALEFLPENAVPNGYYVDEVGFIRDINGTIVGNTLLGDRVNDDGTFTDTLGYTHRIDGTMIDAFGNVRNLDGSITTFDGFTYYLDGSVKALDGLIYHTDGSVEYPDGSVRDVLGLIHKTDGSIVTPDGITYYVDGSIEYPDGTKVLPDGVVMKNNAIKKTEGSWEYDPITSGWKFFTSDINGNKTYYKNEWIATENKNGNITWYIIDNYGSMMTGWVKVAGEFYYMSPAEENRGELMKGNINVAGRLYRLDYNTGKLLDNVEPANFNVLGAVNHKSGVDGNWKDAPDKKGRMFMKKNVRADGKVTEEPVTGWFMIDGHYYDFDDDGITKTGLVISDGKYYYLEADGKMLEGGEKIIDGVTYVFDKATGACRSSRVDKENLL